MACVKMAVYALARRRCSRTIPQASHPDSVMDIFGDGETAMGKRRWGNTDPEVPETLVAEVRGAAEQTLKPADAYISGT
ncbi:hypothetical protein Poly21_40080 [Allorhodopirellula heiligendammensis]|uniref:Uncharacterized protein n=1 Tax=Allorhodopirellula heiligendammensis TaxID=2714739 RepID=A0A5C6BZF3_9BACT|nr:hypothetical protein Poly21_40080 [Allorhodopirellula heiligendammensis]